jgi:hypothetical protein
MTVMICTGTNDAGKPCKKPYALPIPYKDANALIRDLCPECIDRFQREHREGIPAAPKEKPANQEWF